MSLNLDLLRFLFVGIGSNVINFAVYILICSGGASLFSASAVGYSTGLLFSYHFGRVWVFGREFNVSRENLIRFAAVYAIGGLGMSTIIELLDKMAGIEYRLSWLIGACYAVANNYAGLKWLVFNKNEENDGN